MKGGIQEGKTSRLALTAVLIGIVAAAALIAGVAVIVLGALDDDSVSGPTPDTSSGSSTTSGAGSTTSVPRDFAYGNGECPPAEKPAEPPRTFEQAPQRCIQGGTTYRAVVATNRGSFTITLDAGASPANDNNFVALSRWGYYDATTCPMAIADFTVQCGRPAGVEGAPGYSVPDELPAAGAYTVGVVAMANSGRPDSGGGEWFIVTGRQVADIPPTYTVIGRVTKGQETTVAALAALADPDAPAGGAPTKPIRIRTVRIVES